MLKNLIIALLVLIVVNFTTTLKAQELNKIQENTNSKSQVIYEINEFNLLDLTN